MLLLARTLIFLVSLFLHEVFAKDFNDELEKDYPLRSMMGLQILNAKGDITVQGWALDKIRIKVKRHVNAESEEKAQTLLKSIEYRYQVAHDRIEISNQYSPTISIEERLQEKAGQKVRADFVVYAPSKLKLMLWTADGKISLKSWNESAEIRSNSGLVQVESLKGDHLSLRCSSCSAYLRNIRADLRCLGKSGFIHLDTVSGKSIFVETESGTLRLSHVDGEQLYVAQSGGISGQFLRGKIQCHTKHASVDLREISGFLSGTTETGNFSGTIKEWKPIDEVLIETLRGNVNIAMPRQFTANVDIWSIFGTTAVDFPIQKYEDPSTFGPEPANHLIGRIREGGDLLKVFSESGDISITKR